MDRPETFLDSSDPNGLHRFLFEEAPDGIFITDPQSRFVAVNLRGTELTGYSREELLGMSITDLIPPEDLARDPIPMDDLRQGKIVLKERRILRKDGSLMAAEISARMLPAGNLLGIVRDTTGREHAENQLRASEEKFRRLIETTGTGYVILDASGHVTDANQEYVHLTGRQELAEVIGHSVLEWTAPHDLERNASEVRKYIEQGPVRHLEIDYVTPSGELVPVEINATTLRAPGTLRILALARDISKRKRSEDALRRANLVVENSPVVLFRWRAAEGWPVVMASQNVIQFGYTPEELLSGAVPFAAMVHPEDLDRVAREVQEYSASGTDRFQQEYRIVTKDGRLRYVDDRTVVERNVAGQIAFYQGIVIDITERKRAEEALRATNEQLQALVQSFPVAIIVLDPEGHVKLWNPASERVFGWTETEVLDRFLPYVPADKIEEHGVLRARVLRGESFTGIEVRSRRKDGMPVDLSVSTVPLRDAQGRITGIMSVNVDITDRRRAEEALRESEDRFTVFMEHLPAGAFMKDVPGQVVYANRYLCDLFGWDNIIGRSTSELLPSEIAEKMAADDRAALAQGPITVTEQVRDVANCERIFQTSKFPIARQGRMPLLGGISVDITELKQAEKALRSSLEEKESLLKEVHHRVKNNLQVVSSLLSLQFRQVKNPEVRSFLRDTQNRIRSMAMLHEILYRSDNFAKIGFPHYAKRVCAHVARSYGSDAKNIRLKQEIADVALNPDQAITAGLIINELVANAFKHAFPSRSGGEICVELQAAGEHRLVLRVSDNGVGFPAETSPQSAETLGLLLVSNLSRQLNGQMSVNSEQGTVIQIVFPAHSI